MVENVVQLLLSWLLEVFKELNESRLDCCDVLRVRDLMNRVRCSNLGARNVIEGSDANFGWRMGVGEIGNVSLRVAVREVRNLCFRVAMRLWRSCLNSHSHEGCEVVVSNPHAIRSANWVDVERAKTV